MRKSKSALFLMELIIVIFFFALTSAVCLKLFVNAHTVSRRTKVLNNAVLWSSNCAEIFDEFYEDSHAVMETVSAGTGHGYVSDGDTCIFFVDKDFAFVGEPSFYRINIRMWEEEGYYYQYFSYVKEENAEIIFERTIKKHKREVPILE